MWLPLPDLALLLFLTSKWVCTSMLDGHENWFDPALQTPLLIFCQILLLQYLWALVQICLLIQQNLPTYCNKNELVCRTEGSHNMWVVVLWIAVVMWRPSFPIFKDNLSALFWTVTIACNDCLIAAFPTTLHRIKYFSEKCIISL